MVIGADWINPLITGGVGLGGALIGVVGSLLVSARTESAQQRREHRAALIGYWAAVNSFAGMYASISDLLPAGANFLQRIHRGLQVGGQTAQLLTRLWQVTDKLWEASGRLRAVASEAELAAMDRIERIIGDWQIGTPLPEMWGPAIRQLRVLVEARHSVADHNVDQVGESYS